MSEQELELWRSAYVAALRSGADGREPREVAAECAVHADLAMQEYRRRFYNRHTRDDHYSDAVGRPVRPVTVELYADRLAREERES